MLTKLLFVGFTVYITAAEYIPQGGYLFDVTHPILITENAFPRDNVTFFGTSVAFSKNTKSNDSESPTGWIFIGAPTSTSTDPTLKNVSNPGVVWRCSLGRQNGNICEIINIDPKPKVTKKNKLGRREGGPFSEDEGNTWIGGIVEVKNGRLVTCGHRYTRGENTIMDGICYWLSNHPEKAEQYEVKEGYHHRLLPFFDLNNPTKHSFINNTATGEFFELRFGQVGTSLHMVENITGGAELILGAPGVRMWSGAIVRYTDNPTDKKSTNFRSNRDRNDSTYSEFVVAFRGSKIANDTNNHWGDYFGYGVSAGRYFDSGKLLYAGGAPRAKGLTGAVVIFDIDSKVDDADEPQNRGVKPLLEIFLRSKNANKTKKGLGSYFGSVLLSLDMDGDGRDELLVGAPMYTIPPSRLKRSLNEPGLSRSGDHGCVFIYSFTNTSKIMNEQKLCGDSTPGARFGSAMSYIRMSSNPDDANDLYIVIGAPYEMDGRGAIYIYKAERELQYYFQKINAQDISSNMYGFGCSISLAEDVDDSDTPDIAVGAYTSNQVVVLRTRPRIKLVGTIKLSDDKNLSLTDNNPEIIVCAKIIQDFGSISDSLKIWAKITVDNRISIEFLKFKKGQRNKSRSAYGNETREIVYEMTVFAPTYQEENIECQKIGTRIMVNFSDYDTNSKVDLSPIHITQELWYNETQVSEIAKVINLVEYRIKNMNETNVSGKIDFKKDKPMPSTSKRDYYKDINLCERNPCIPKLTVNGEWFHPNDVAYDNPLKNYTIGAETFPEILLRVNISNTGDILFRSISHIEWPLGNPVVELSKDTKNSFLLSNKSCPEARKTVPNTLIYKCELQQIIKNQSVYSMVFKLNLRKVFANKPRTVFKVFMYAHHRNISQEPYESESFTAKLMLIANSSIKIEGSKLNTTLLTPIKYEIKEWDAKKGTSIYGTAQKVLEMYPFRQSFKTYITGPSGVGSVRISFKLPFDLKLKENDPPMRVVLIHPNQNKKNLKCEFSEVKNSPLFSIKPLKFNTAKKISSKANVPSRIGVTENNFNLQPNENEGRGNRSATKTLGSGMVFRSKSKVDTLTNRNSTTMKLAFRQAKTSLAIKTFNIHCNDESANFKCVDVICVAENVRGNSFVEVSFEMFLIKNAIDKLVTEEIADFTYESKGMAEIFGEPPSDIVHNFMYKNSDTAQTRFAKVDIDVASWVYVVAIVFGIFQLLLLIFIMYKCGFFKREKQEDLKQLKEQDRRTRMLRESFFPNVGREKDVEGVESLLDERDISVEAGKEDLKQLKEQDRRTRMLRESFFPNDDREKDVEGVESLLDGREISMEAGKSATNVTSEENVTK